MGGGGGGNKPKQKKSKGYGGLATAGKKNKIRRNKKMTVALKSDSSALLSVAKCYGLKTTAKQSKYLLLFSFPA